MLCMIMLLFMEVMEHRLKIGFLGCLTSCQSKERMF